MQTTINERINMLVKSLCFRSKRAFSKKIGVAQTSFNAILNGAEPKFSTLSKILEAIPNINAEWLITGKGDMLNKTEFDEKIKPGDIETITMPREVFDQISKLTETVFSQQKTIEILTETNKKIVVQGDGNVTCADASGSGIQK